jgi:quinol monooxygenase YgiN
MINVLASLQIKENKMAEFLAIFKANVPNVLKEKGCIEYVPTIDVPTDLPPQDSNKKVVTIIEKWESLEDLLAHLKAPHMLAYGEKVKDIVEKKSLKILRAA